MRFVASSIDFLVEKISLAAMWILVPMFGVSLYEVIARNLFNSPTTWAAPVITILFVAATVPAGADLAARQGHVRMDAFYAKCSPWTKNVADLFAAFILLAFASVLSWKAMQMAATSLAIQEASWGSFRAPIYPKKIIFATGAVLLSLEALALIAKGIRALRKGRP